MNALGRLLYRQRDSTGVGHRSDNASGRPARTSMRTATVSSPRLSGRAGRKIPTYGWDEESYRLAGSENTSELESKLSATFREQSWLPEDPRLSGADDVSFQTRLQVDGEWRHHYNKRIMQIQHATSLLNAGLRAGVDFYAVSATRATSRDHVNQVTKYEGYRCLPIDLVDEDGRVVSGGFCLPSGFLAANVVVEIAQDPENRLWLVHIPLSTSRDKMIPYMLDDETGQKTLDRARGAVQLRGKIRYDRDGRKEGERAIIKSRRNAATFQYSTRSSSMMGSMSSNEEEAAKISPSMKRENKLALRTIMPTLWAQLTARKQRTTATIRNAARDLEATSCTGGFASSVPRSVEP